MTPWLWPALTIALVCACACLPASQVQERAFWRQRDWALLGAVALGAFGALSVGEYWLCPMALWALCRWRSSATLPSVVVWLAIAGLWLLAVGALRAPAAQLAAAAALAAIAMLQTGYAAAQWWINRRHPSPAQRAPRGTFGQRTLFAAYLAMALPLATVVWPAGALATTVIAGGLLLVASWTAWTAACAALIVLNPWIGLPLTAGLGLLVACGIAASGAGAWDVPRGNWAYRLLQHGTLRGTSVDSMRQRWRTWRLALRLWPTSTTRLIFGSGPGELQYDLLRWDARGASVINGYAHSEPVQMVYEYGLCGAAAMALFAWRVAPGLAIGDPWSAAAVAGAVCACGSIICRTPATGVPWLVCCAVVAARRRQRMSAMREMTSQRRRRCLWYLFWWLAGTACSQWLIGQ